MKPFPYDLSTLAREEVFIGPIILSVDSYLNMTDGLSEAEKTRINGYAESHVVVCDGKTSELVAIDEDD